MNITQKVINAKSKKEILKIINTSIKKQTLKALKNNIQKKFIGADLNINPNFKILTKDYFDDDYDEDFEVNGYWKGYIPRNVKLTYAFSFLSVFSYDNIDTYHYDFGSYYYLDDISFIYKFAFYLNDLCEKGEEINEFEFLDIVYMFLDEHFANYLYSKDRADLHQLIYSDYYRFHKPETEHSIYDFQNSGAAMCSEYACAANNILNVFNYKCMYLQDTHHAYNLVLIPKEGKRNEYDYYIYDCSCSTINYVFDSPIPERIPYLTLLEDFDDESLKQLLQGKIRVHPKEYFSYEINDNFFDMYTNDERDYGVYSHSPQQENKTLILKK